MSKNLGIFVLFIHYFLLKDRRLNSSLLIFLSTLFVFYEFLTGDIINLSPFRILNGGSYHHLEFSVVQGLIYNFITHFKHTFQLLDLVLKTFILPILEQVHVNMYCHLKKMFLLILIVSILCQCWWRFFPDIVDTVHWSDSQVINNDCDLDLGSHSTWAYGVSILRVLCQRIFSTLYSSSHDLCDHIFTYIVET